MKQYIVVEIETGKVVPVVDGFGIVWEALPSLKSAALEVARMNREAGKVVYRVEAL